VNPGEAELEDALGRGGRRARNGLQDPSFRQLPGSTRWVGRGRGWHKVGGEGWGWPGGYLSCERMGWRVDPEQLVINQEPSLREELGGRGRDVVTWWTRAGAIGRMWMLSASQPCRV
jgi:hypothetical protein